MICYCRGKWWRAVVLMFKEQSSFPYLDLSFRAGLAADRADHVAAVHLDHVLIQAEHALVPGADVDVVKNARLHVLEVHNLVPEWTESLELEEDTSPQRSSKELREARPTSPASHRSRQTKCPPQKLPRSSS